MLYATSVSYDQASATTVGVNFKYWGTERVVLGLSQCDKSPRVIFRGKEKPMHGSGKYSPIRPTPRGSAHVAYARKFTLLNKSRGGNGPWP